MKPLLVVIPVWPGDADVVRRNLERQRERDGQSRHVGLIALDSQLLSLGNEFAELTKSCFSKAFLIKTEVITRQWPEAQNRVWQQIARNVEAVKSHECIGWFMWESDALPLKKGWIDTLCEEYHKHKKPFMGHVVPGRGHMNAVAVYPPNISRYCEKAMIVKSTPFDTLLSKEVKGHIAPANNLIAHRLKENGGDPAAPMTPRIRASLPETTVIAHGYYEMTALPFQMIEEEKKTGKPMYSISILCHNNLDLTKRCVASVKAHSKDFEIILTDNGSTDGTLKWLQEVKRDFALSLRIIPEGNNNGFNRPNNNAAIRSEGEYFVMLNNDMEVCPDWLDVMREQFIDSQVALVGIKGACSEIQPSFNGKPGALDYVEASCCMIRTDVARKFGPFSDYLKFAYFEDSDLSLRLREAGYKIASVSLPIKHEHRASTAKLVKGIEEIKESNRKEMLKRWGFYIKKKTFARKVLIRRNGARGDVLFLTPVLREMRRRWKDSKITVETACPEVLQGWGVETSSVPVKDDGFDNVFNLDLAYEKTPKFHVVDAYLKACGLHSDDHRLEFKGKPDGDCEWVNVQMKSNRPILLLHAGPTGWKGRDWPKERFDDVAGRMKIYGWQVATVGTEKNHLIDGTQDMRGTSLSRLYTLLRRSHLFIGIDSLPFNMAQASGIEAIGLFGTINPQYRLCPSNAKAVHASKKDAPCLFDHHELKPPITRSQCEGKCMDAITADMVIDAIRTK